MMREIRSILYDVIVEDEDYESDDEGEGGEAGPQSKRSCSCEATDDELKRR
jgi:hypothetical protein